MDVANVVENVIGLSIDEAGTRDLELGWERENDLHIEAKVKRDVGDEGETERLDYGSSHDEEDEPAVASQTKAHRGSWIQSTVHVVLYDNTKSNKVIFVSCFMLQWMCLSFIALDFGHPCRFIICSF